MIILNRGLGGKDLYEKKNYRNFGCFHYDVDF